MLRRVLGALVLRVSPAAKWAAGQGALQRRRALGAIPGGTVLPCCHGDHRRRQDAAKAGQEVPGSAVGSEDHGDSSEDTGGAGRSWDAGNEKTVARKCTRASPAALGRSDLPVAR